MSRLALPVLVAKVAVDFFVFALGLPLVLRHIVFPAKRAFPVNQAAGRDGPQASPERAG